VKDLPDDALEREGEDAAEGGHPARNEKGPECHAPECQWEAWRLRCSGIYAFLPIAHAVNRKFHPTHPRCPNGPHDNGWAKRAVGRSSKAVLEAIDEGGVAALSEYVQGLREDLAAQMLVSSRGDLDSTDAIRVNARIQVSKLREQIAAACGVTTKREAQNVTGDVNVSVVGRLSSTTRKALLADLEAEGSIEGDEDAADE
jgi:hypothetical protein